MAIITDQELISKLLEATNEGRIRWEKSQVKDQFAAKYGGKWTLTIDKAESDEGPYELYWLALCNPQEEEILRISQEPGLGELFELARRRALKVDEALQDLLNEIEPDKQIKDEDIPF